MLSQRNKNYLSIILEQWFILLQWPEKHYTQSQWHLGAQDLTSNREWKYSCILVFEKSKWIRKQKLTSNICFFLEFFPQLILATGSQNTGPDITVYYGIWARVSTKRAVALFSDVVHTSWISHFKAESIGYLNHLAQKSL